MRFSQSPLEPQLEGEVPEQPEVVLERGLRARVVADGEAVLL